MLNLILPFVVGVLVGAVFSYLFFRANKNKKLAVDEYVNELSEKLKSK